MWKAAVTVPVLEKSLSKLVYSQMQEKLFWMANWEGLGRARSLPSARPDPLSASCDPNLTW
jgi:hypothetical protein